MIRQEDCNVPFDEYKEYNAEGKLVDSNRPAKEAYAEALVLKKPELVFYQVKRIIHVSTDNQLDLRGDFSR